MPLTLLERYVETLGEGHALAVTGLVVGSFFGFLAQRSRFCLRSAVIEFSRNHGGGKLAVWLFGHDLGAWVFESAVGAGGSRQLALIDVRVGICRGSPSRVDRGAGTGA